MNPTDTLSAKDADPLTAGGSRAVGSTPSHPSADAPLPGEARSAARASRIGLLSISLAAAGLGGAWRAATTTASAPIGVADALFVVSGLMWLVLLAGYIRHGGARWRNLMHDLRDPGQGFLLAYVPIVGMLFVGQFARFGLDAARWAYVVFAAMAAFVAARLLAHWFTGTLRSSPPHLGHLLPVSSLPFIASSIASGLQWPELAFAAFAVGVVYTFAVGAVVIGGLMTGPDLPLPARPALTILIIPPATGGLAWLAAHRGAVDAVGYGFAGLLAFTTLIVVCLLPYLRQPSFHMGVWIFAFPIAAGSNFAIRWFHGADVPAWRPLTWVVLGAATLSFVALGTATLFHASRRGPRSRSATA